MTSSRTPARNPIIFIFITRLIDAMGFGIVMPVLPNLLMHMGKPDIAAATSTAGLLLVTYSGMQFFFGPIIGNLSDQFGRRPVILTSLLAYGIDCLLMGFAPTVAWLFLGRAIAGMAGAVFVPANAFVADITPPEKRASAFGLMGAAFGLGFIAGPAIGGLVGTFGPRVPFFVAASLAGLNFLFGLIVMPESLPPERRRKFSWRRANPFGAFLMLKHHPVVLIGALALVCFLLGNNVYPSTWAFFTTARFGWSSLMIGASLAATGASLALVQVFLTGRIVKRVGELRAALIGLSFAAFATITYAFVTQPWMIFVMAFVGGPQAIAYPSLNALMSRQIPPNAQGELQGGVASLSSIANVVGPYAMTQTFAHYTAPNAPLYFPGAAFLLAATLSLTGVALLFVQRARSPHIPHPSPLP
jgi:MFS transporter, DHA1 family, tetracycline resistance protein